VPNFVLFDAGVLKLQQMIKWDVFGGGTRRSEHTAMASGFNLQQGFPIRVLS